MNVCAVIPVYNHGATAGTVVAALRAHGLPCLVVDDGSEPACAAVLDALAGEGVSVLRHARNAGKGAAVMTGLRAAAARGYSHALQIDADGQHDTHEVPRMLDVVRSNPEAVIAGQPIFDHSVPRGRFYARYLTHVWVWINTLSRRIEDTMCGFRIYPLAPVIALMDRVALGRRMNFDTEVLVRLDWAGVRVINHPVRVVYPRDGISHFQPLRDNLLLSGTHARLFFGMLWRAPRLLARHFRRSG